MSLPMPPVNNTTTLHHHHHHHHYPGGDMYTAVRRGSSAQNSTSSFSDDEDAITPCTTPVTRTSSNHQQQQQQQHQERSQSPRPQHRPQTNNVPRPTSWRDSIEHGAPQHLEGLEADTNGHESDVDSETLWHRMLAIQRVFGCYNSARMRAALEMGGDGNVFIPSRTCLDLLNDSIDQLPEESKRKLEEFLEKGGTKSSKRRSWRQRLLQGQPLLASLESHF